MSNKLNPAEGSSEPKILGHSYDGIQEYDNPLPGWWKWSFAVTVLFSVPYFVYYHMGGEGRGVLANYEVAQVADMRKRFAKFGKDMKGDTATIVKYMNDSEGLNMGKSIYKANCVACHGREGGGLVGPNLTDEAYKNVRQLEDVFRVVQNGASSGAMPAWKGRLLQPELVLVSSYVASLRGADPGASPKDPEGELIPPWPTLKDFPVHESDADETETNSDPEAAVEGQG